MLFWNVQWNSFESLRIAAGNACKRQVSAETTLLQEWQREGKEKGRKGKEKGKGRAGKGNVCAKGKRREGKGKERERKREGEGRKGKTEVEGKIPRP